ncbi:hypothetical protein GCM10028807_53220 [Spirosoma daeguense]
MKKKAAVPSSSSSYASQFAPRHIWLFRLIAVALPFIVLGSLEGLLRLLGYGHDMRLFVDDPRNSNYWIMNKYASEKYFSETTNATFGNFEPFRKQKAEGTLRIFILGESTTIGFPYMHNGSFHRWLQYRLNRTFPDRNFEIINLALTAVNSHTVYGFAKELPNYQPDVVLVYTGHNEYYGAAGIGSTSSIAQNPNVVRLVLKAREFRVIQLIRNVTASLRPKASGSQSEQRDGMMKRMAADQQIPLDSDAYQAGIKQFATNLNDLCQLLTEQKIPVFVSNVVSNQKDLKPLEAALDKSTGPAAQTYQQAGQAYVAGNFSEAKKQYVQAKELDRIRFRAPEAINQAIQELSARYPGVTLVDTKVLFEQHSENGILGNETLLEHVHPNLLGYALLSEAFYLSLKKQRIITPQPNQEMSFAQLKQQMPITVVDSLYGTYEINLLKCGWPFNESIPEKSPSNLDEQLAQSLVRREILWENALNQLADQYAKQNNLPKAVQVIDALMLEYPLEPNAPTQAGKLLLKMNRNEEAVTYLKKAFQLENSFERAQQLFITLLKLDRPDEALPYLHYATANNQSGFSLNELQSFVEQLVALKKQYAQDTTNVALSNQLAIGYLKFANADAASRYVAKTLRQDPRNEVARQLQEKIKAIRK